MAGVTDVAFRALAKRCGAALTYTEFVSSTALVRGSKKTEQMIVTDPSEKPAAIQLFGSSVNDVVEAAKMVEDRFDVIDVNCGCPAWKVIKTGAGSELLRKPEGIASFISKLAGAVSKPVTLKIRTGIDEKHINALDVARQAEDAGAAAIGIHGRTQKQGYRGIADWDIIKKVKELVNIPVIGNGDVFTPETFKQRLDESGVDYILIARGAVGNPYIFTQIKDFMEKGVYGAPDRKKLFSELLSLARKHQVPFAAIKDHALHLTKGIDKAAALRDRISRASTVEEISSLITSS